MTDDRQPIRAARLFSDAIARAGLTEPQIELLKQVARETISPRDLFSPTPIERTLQQLEASEQTIALILGTGKKPSDSHFKERTRHQQRLALHARREEMLSQRQAQYPGCWCFALGGKDEIGLAAYHPEHTFTGWDGKVRPLPLTAPEALAAAGIPDWTFRDLCDHCPEGQALLVQRERGLRVILADYRQRILKLRWKRTGIPDTIHDFALDAYPDQRKIVAVEAWYHGELLPGQSKYRAGLLLSGENQRGKSTIGYLMALRAFTAGQSVLCRTLPDLFGELHATYDNDSRQNRDPDQPKAATHEQLVEYLKTVWLLMLDDLGTEKYSQPVEQTLFRLLEARKQAGASLRTIITTNLKVTETAERFGPRNWARLEGMFGRVVIDWDMMGPSADGLLDLDMLVESA